MIYDIFVYPQMLEKDHTDREDIPFRQLRWKVCCSLKWLLTSGYSFLIIF